MKKRWISHIVLVNLIVFASALTVLASPADAHHEYCENEPLLSGQDDFGVDVGPGLLFVGVDKGDMEAGVSTPTSSATVCIASDALGLDLAVEVDRGDVVPQIEFGSNCALDVAGGACELRSFQVVIGDGDVRTVDVYQSGLPAGDDVTTVTLPYGRLCLIAVAQPCSP